MSVSADLRALADDLDPMVAKALGRTALAVKRRMVAAAPSRLSGVGKRGVRLGVRYDFVKGSKGKGVRIRATGPWQFIEYDRRGGYPIPKRPKKRGKRRLLLVNGDVVTGPVRGGHASGKHVWAKALPRALDEVSDIFDDEFARVVRSA